MPPQHSHLRLSREQLYELVWVKPMQHLAKEYGVSDRALAKLCSRRQVPVPPRGYWAKKLSGGKVEQPKLLPFIEKEKPKAVAPEPEKTKSIDQTVPFVDLWKDRNLKVKSAIKDFHLMLRDGTSYKIRVDGWSCDFSFGLNAKFNPLRHSDVASFMYREPYHESRWLVLHGEFLEPSKLAGQKVRINLSQCDYLNEAERTKNARHYEEKPPTSVGTLYKEEADFWCLLFFPTDAADLVLQIAAANKVQAITLYGDKLRYKQAPIFSFSLKSKIEEGDEVQTAD